MQKHNGLTSISLGNYRSLAKTIRVPLRPITLLFGYNSAGKSAILRSLPLLAASARTGTSGPVNLNAQSARGATFRDLTSKYTDSDVINVALEWRRGVVSRVEYDIRDLPDQRRQIVECLRLFDRKCREIATFEWVPGHRQHEGDLFNFSHYDQKAATKTKSEVLVDFDGLTPTSQTNNINIIGAISLLTANLADFEKSVTWLNALRCATPRWSLLSGKLERISADGGGITQALALAPDEVMQTVSSWYEATTGYKVEVKWGAVQGREVFSLGVHPSSNPKVSLDIVDTGEGIGQVLPVVGLLSLAKHGQLGQGHVLAIEHPELHLHPDAHTSLANLFCEVATSDSEPSIIVETHSENFLLAVQLAIVDRRLRSDQVVIYWVRETPAGAAIEAIEFDDLGRPLGNNWPPGVFSETAKSSKRLFVARREKEADADSSNS